MRKQRKQRKHRSRSREDSTSSSPEYHSPFDKRKHRKQKKKKDAKNKRGRKTKNERHDKVRKGKKPRKHRSHHNKSRQHKHMEEEEKVSSFEDITNLDSDQKFEMESKQFDRTTLRKIQKIQENTDSISKKAEAKEKGNVCHIDVDWKVFQKAIFGVDNLFCKCAEKMAYGASVDHQIIQCKDCKDNNEIAAYYSCQGGSVQHEQEKHGGARQVWDSFDPEKHLTEQLAKMKLDYLDNLFQSILKDTKEESELEDATY